MKKNTHANSAQTHVHNHKANAKPLEGAFSQLRPEIQKAIQKEAYTTPTPIQEQCIPALLAGRDLIGTAQTGTGKTAAFTLPMLQKLKDSDRKAKPGNPRVLILAPTRELAAQIGDSIQTYGKFLSQRHTTIFGGVNQHPQVKALRRGVDIVIATPGRLLDLKQQGHIRLNEVDTFILDEVDRMLDMGFLPDIRKVLKDLPKEHQTIFLSATMPPKLRNLAGTMVHDPVEVSITPEKPAVESIKQKVMFVGKHNKDALLVSLMDQDTIGKAIVFTQMKHVANRVAKKLQTAGIDGEAIHGNKSQAARTKILNGFRRGRFQVLVATDVAARGLDVDDVTHVINYDLPVEAETYIHRIGRTARAGAEGDAISFCSAEERSQLLSIEHLIGTEVDRDEEHAYHAPDKFTPPPLKKTFRNKGRRRSNSRPFGRR